MPKEEAVEPKKEPSEPSEPSTNESGQTNKNSSEGSSSAVASKRTFVPNVGVQRAKKDVLKEESSKQQEQKGRRSAQPNLKAVRGGRGGSRGDNLIQSHSIFEAGPGTSIKRYGGDKEYYESTTRISSTSYSSGAQTKKEPGSSNQDLARPLKIEEHLLIEDQKASKDDNVYIDFKFEPEKTEFKCDDTNEQDEAKYSALRNVFDPLDPNEKSGEKLVLFQIPETLGLSEMNEDGHIGKLRIRKSGKVELCINQNIIFDVSLSVCGSFLQEATVLEIKDEQQSSGKLINLGHVENKIVASHRI